MTYEETIQHKTMLNDLRNSKLEILTWLAALDDELRAMLPDTSSLMARFEKIKADAEKTLTVGGDDKSRNESIQRVRESCFPLIDIIIKRASTVQAPRDLVGDQTRVQIKDEIEWSFRNSFIKSLPVRILIILFGVALFLITGEATYKVTTQIAAMNKLLNDAQSQMNASNGQIREISDNIKDKQAALALSLLNGNEEMAKLRTGALTEMSAEESGFKTTVDKESTDWQMSAKKIEGKAETGINDTLAADVKSLDEKTAASSKQLDADLKLDKIRIEKKTEAILATLEAEHSPWVPVAVWSHAMSWMLVPVAFVMTLLAWLSAWLAHAHGVKNRAAFISWANLAFLCLTMGLVFWLRFKG